MKHKEMELHPVLRKLLAQRGITEESDVQEYLSPVPKMTFDPFLMKGMEEAVELILDHIDRGSRICVYGDYDADGVTSVTLLTEYLGCLTSNITYYIPSRFEEGYGLNCGAADRIAADGTGLIITVDCGCVADREVSYIQSLGMDIIVTDHHEVDERKPDCILLDPKQEGETYPYRQLCGCGVAFKLAQAVGRRRDIPKSVLNRTLDIVGIATIADVVPLTGENRTLVKYGFDRIRKRQRPGLLRLIDRIGLQPDKLTSYNISFGIAPHINSAGRLRTAGIAVELLSAESGDEAAGAAEQLVRLNQERRRLQDELYRSAVEAVEAEPDEPLIFYNAGDAHEGVTGIVAGKLKERYSRPVILLARAGEKGLYKGTGRSVSGVSIIELIRENAPLFTRFGGHAAACGFTIPEENLGLLRANLIRSLCERLEEDPELLDEPVTADLTIDADQVTMELARQISLMEPFGAGNPMPLFRIPDLNVRFVRTMGADGRYRKYLCESYTGLRLEAVLFDDAIPDYESVKAGDRLTVVAEIGINEWNGRSSVQLVIRDLVISS